MVTIDQIIAQKLNEWVVGEWPIGNMVACIIALLLSIILCGAIGIERERRGRSAGLRTHLLVGVGSCMVMIISIYGFPLIKIEGVTWTRDIARLAAQVVAGVGFLGAGAIIYRNSGTKGLTTAATIWIVMAIGLACGSMNFILAVGGTLLILMVLIVFRKIETRINQKAPLFIVKATKNVPITSKILEIAKGYNCTIAELNVELLDAEEVEVTFLLSTKAKDFDRNSFAAKLHEGDGVLHVSMVNNHKG